MDRINMWLNCICRKHCVGASALMQPMKTAQVFFSKCIPLISHFLIHINAVSPDLCLLHRHFSPIRERTATNLPIIPPCKKNVFFLKLREGRAALKWINMNYFVPNTDLSHIHHSVNVCRTPTRAAICSPKASDAAAESSLSCRTHKCF